MWDYENLLNTLEVLIYDLEAAEVCSTDVALRSTLAQNLSRSDALIRRNARAQLADIGSLQGSIGSAFNEEAHKSFAAVTRRLQRLAGMKPSEPAGPKATPMGRLVGVE